MEHRSRTEARLLVDIPSERVDETMGDGGQPKIGDIVLLTRGLPAQTGSLWHGCLF